MTQTIETLVKQASSKLQAQDFSQAIQLYQQALAIQPNNAAAQMGLAMTYNRQGESNKALELLQIVWRTVQTNSAKDNIKVQTVTIAEILAQIGLALHQLGQLDEALMFYAQANTIHNNEALKRRITELSGNASGAFEKLVNQGHNQQANQQLDDAILAYKSALQLYPDNDRAQYGLGNALRLKGNLAAALPYIQQAIIMQPEVAEYHNTLGMLFQQKGEFEKAITHHKRATNLDAKYAAAYCNLGVALKNLNRTEEAIETYKKALKINPNMPEAHNNLGNLLRIMGDIKKAKTSLKKALKLRPDYPDAKRNLDDLMALTPKKRNAKTT